MDKSERLESIGTAIKSNINDAAHSFVSTGFYLKQVRDEKLYIELEYKDIWEYAASEFGISKSNACRFMKINDKFSVGGNSANLVEQYNSFSYSKLQEMLTLSEEQLNDITEEMTVKQIREIKKAQDVPDEVIIDGGGALEDDKEDEPEMVIHLEEEVDSSQQDIVTSFDMSEYSGKIDDSDNRLVEQEDYNDDDPYKPLFLSKDDAVKFMADYFEEQHKDLLYTQVGDKYSYESITENLSNINLDITYMFVMIKKFGSFVSVKFNKFDGFNSFDVRVDEIVREIFIPVVEGKRFTQYPDCETTCENISDKPDCIELDVVKHESDIAELPVTESEIHEVENNDIDTSVYNGKISNCPFCGKEMEPAVMCFDVKRNLDRRMENVNVRCYHCGASGGSGWNYDAALRKWNNRNDGNHELKVNKQVELPEIDGLEEFIECYEKWPIWIDSRNKTGETYYRICLNEFIEIVVKSEIKHSLKDRKEYKKVTFYIKGVKTDTKLDENRKCKYLFDNAEHWTFSDSVCNKDAVIEYIKQNCFDIKESEGKNDEK